MPKAHPTMISKLIPKIHAILIFNLVGNINFQYIKFKKIQHGLKNSLYEDEEKNICNIIVQKKEIKKNNFEYET